MTTTMTLWIWTTDTTILEVSTKAACTAESTTGKKALMINTRPISLITITITTTIIRAIIRINPTITSTEAIPEPEEAMAMLQSTMVSLLRSITSKEHLKRKREEEMVFLTKRILIP